VASSHFNKGVVRGRILELKVRKTTANKKPYLELKVFCPSGVYGDITVKVRFWGPEVEALKAAYKERKGGMFYFHEGDVAMLESRGRKFLGYNAYKFRPWAESPEDQPRASIIIEGVLEVDFEKFSIRHIRGGSFPVNAVFDFPEPEFETEATPGDRVTVYGHLKDRHARFGSTGEAEPVIEEIQIRERGHLVDG